MSKREYDKFMRALADDPQLAERLHNRIEEAGELNAVDVTAEFAKSHGFKVDAKDIREARA